MNKLLVIFFILIFTGCVTKGSDSYDAGVKLFQEMKYRESIPDFDKAISENPDFGEAYLYKGRAFTLLQQYDSSINNYQQALGIFKQGKFNGNVLNVPDNKKVSQVQEVWLPYAQLQQKIQQGIPLTDIEIQKQAEIIKRLDPK